VIECLPAAEFDKILANEKYLSHQIREIGYFAQT
jgi:hypothetical protein